MKYFCRLPVVFLVFSLGLCLALFYGVLFGDRQFTYRDESHFHYPLYQYIQTELERGHFPLWTPYDNLGQPFFANAALGILYPGKLIFFLPFDYSILFNIFIVGHVFLASATLYHLARCWGIGPWAAIFGALAYAFGGTVLGQYCNPTFLVGAAWTPEAVLWGDRMLTRRRSVRQAWCNALIFAAILSFMLLVGDPQAAFQVGMIISLLALFRFLRTRRLLRRAGPRVVTEKKMGFQEGISTFLRHRAILLGIVVVATFLLSAVQILPTQEFSRLCNRAGYKNPRSLWEIPGFLLAKDKDLAKDEILFDDSSIMTRKEADVANLSRGQRIYNGLFLQGNLDAHHGFSYNFSTHPIQFVNYFWPQATGSFFPQFDSWLTGVVTIYKAANWHPTFYMGVLPCLLMLVTLRFRIGKEQNIRIVWLSWCLFFTLWASLGFYGLGWLLHSLGFPAQVPFTDIAIAPALGSGYWFLQVFIPGYIQFRYPAKLLTLAALPLAMLAAYGFDRLVIFLRSVSTEPERSLIWLWRWCTLFIFLSLLLAIPASMRDEWYQLAQHVPNEPAAGPFQPALARTTVLTSFLQTAAVLSLFLVLVRYRRQIPTKTLLSLLLLSLAFDLYLSCRRYIVVADRDIFTRDEKAVLRLIENDADGIPTRFMLNVKPLPRWKQESSPDRVAEFAIENRRLMQMQFHYSVPHNEFGNLVVAKVVESGTMVPYSYAQWVTNNLRNDFRLEQNLARIGAQYALMDVSMPLDPKLATLVARDDTAQTPPNWPENAALWKLKEPGSRVWIERDGRRIEPKETGESVEIIDYQPEQVVIAAELTQPGTVVLSDQFWPGWHLTVEQAITSDAWVGEDGTIRPVEDVFRGVDLQPGSYRLTYRYTPQSFRNGVALSAVSWCLLVVVLVAGWPLRSQIAARKT